MYIQILLFLVLFLSACDSLHSLKGDTSNKNSKKIVEKNKQLDVQVISDSENLESLIKKFEHGFDLDTQNQEEQTELHIAVKNNYVNSVEWLLKQNVEIDIQDNLKNTPLHLAFQLQKKIQQQEMSDLPSKELNTINQIITMLFDNGADPYIKNLEGKIPAGFSLP